MVHAFDDITLKGLVYAEIFKLRGNSLNTSRLRIFVTKAGNLVSKSLALRNDSFHSFIISIKMRGYAVNCSHLFRTLKRAITKLT